MKLGAIIYREFLQLLFIVLSFTLMVVVSYCSVNSIITKQLLDRDQETLNTAEAVLRAEIREAEAVLFQAGLVLEEWLEGGKTPEEAQSYLSMLAASMNAGENRVRSFRLTDAPAAAVNIDASPRISEAAGVYVLSLSKVLYGRDGKACAVIAMDLDFSRLAEYIRSFHADSGGYGMLCSGDLVFLVHGSESYVNRSMNESGGRYEAIARKIQKNPDEVATNRAKEKQGVQVVDLFRKMYNGWYLGMATPVDAYYKNLKRMALILSGLGAAFMVILSFILIRSSISRARSEEENKEKTSFLARMSHEIRTPMNSILGMAELIERKAVSSEIQEYIEIIHHSGNNLLAIINDILDFSKIESGRLQIQNRNYYIASVINDMINIFRPRVAEKSLDFLVNVDSSIPAQLFGDDMRLRHILTNLLSNAVKYTRKGFVSLHITMERTGSGALRLICMVEDSGIGIKSEDVKRLFGEFVRMDLNANQGIEGTGLGLVITRALCRAMGGDVTVSSEYAKGSVFRAAIMQEFREDGKSVAEVNKAGEKKVLFYDWRPHYENSMTDTFKSLGVQYSCSGVFQDFLRELELGAYDYAFISSKYAMDCIYALGRRATPLELVIMVEPGEMAVYRDVTSIQMPAYVIPVANVLNNMTDDVDRFRDKKLKIPFIAPTVKILIVDDISTNLRVAKELMAPYAMHIHTCLSGSEALNLIGNNDYDLIFMDHMMPGMDGIETTAFIRALDSGDGYYTKLPIVALTANAVSGQREMFLEQGINDFLAKPIDVQELNKILEKWLPAEKRIESTQVRKTPEKTEKTESIVIPGVDDATGLRNCGGTVSVYCNILEEYCQDAGSRLGQITDALAAGNTKLFTTLVHALKGASRSIGAMETGDKAFWLEENAASGDAAEIKEKTAELLENAKTLIGNIRSALEKHSAGDSRETVDISELRLDSLKKALAEMDIEAVNKMLLDYAGLSLDSKTKGMIAEVEQHILMFEYDKAIDKIGELF